MAPMILRSLDGAWVALRPLDYQCPEPEVSTDSTDDWDDWLQIGAEVTLPDNRHWSFEDPCLTTDEAAALSTWLHDAAGGSVRHDALANASAASVLLFTEPNLAFSLAFHDAAAMSLRVHFAAESLPPWVTTPALVNGLVSGFFVEIRIAGADLERAVARWDTELARLPKRTPR